MTHPDVLLQTTLPDKDKFFNDLTQSHISDECYAFAQKVWQVFRCRNLKDYLHVYLLADCLLLADVFENYRDCCLTDYRLDPTHYFSSPHFTFDASLLYSGVQSELLGDVDQYLFLNRAMQGVCLWFQNGIARRIILLSHIMILLFLTISFFSSMQIIYMGKL